MGDNRSRTGDAPGDEGPAGSVVDPTAASGPGEDEVETIVSGGTGSTGTGAAAAAEVGDDDESEPLRAE